MSKNDLRKSMLERRACMRAEDVDFLGAQIQRRIIESDLFAASRMIGSYIQLGNEVPTDKIHHIAHATGKILAVPFCRGPRDSYCFVRLDKDAMLERGASGARQPIETQEASITDCDLVLVPGVAFSRRGERLGRGGAVYDDLLAASDAPKIGLCFAFQIWEEVPVEPHDQRVDWITTEDEFFRVDVELN